MKIKVPAILLLSVFMLGLTDPVEAQYNRYRKTNRKISRYKGGIVGGKVIGYGRFRPYKFAGLSLNALNYFGDLAPINKFASTDISFTRPGFGFYGGYRFHHSMAVRAGFNYGRIVGDDIRANRTEGSGNARYQRNLSFRNDIFEFQLGLEIFFFPNYGGPNQRLPFNAYFSFGAAVFYHDPETKVPDANYQKDITGATPAPQAGQWVKLKPLGTEGQNIPGTQINPYSNIQFAIPIAVGTQMRIPRSNLNVGIEFGLRYLFFDYLDDVSGTYVDLSTLDSDLVRLLSDRSSEPVGAVSGNTRDVTPDSRVTGQGYTYNTVTALGAGSDGGIRGNPKNSDGIFMTRLKVTYVIRSVRRRRGKFR